MFASIKNKTTNLEQVFTPKATMISPCMCMSCYKVGRIPYNSSSMGLNHPDPMVIFCEDKVCKQKAYDSLYVFMTKFGHPHPIRSWHTKKDLTCKVLRSNGDVDIDWKITDIIFNEEGVATLYVYSPEKQLQKAVIFDAFLELNPDLKETVEEIALRMIDYVFGKFDGLL